MHTTTGSGRSPAGAGKAGPGTSALELVDRSVPGCFEIRPRVFADHRGRFVKVFVEEVFAARGLATRFAEEFYTVSARGVVRGMHLQLPPHDHDKIVYCPAGSVLDVVLDLRVGSPTFRRWDALELSAEAGNGLYIPRGVAHGFYALTDQAVMAYLVTTPHAPSHDAGIRWDSFGMIWPDPAPTLSARDAALPALEDFASPFEYGSRQP
jgi:dTDP-4-dehydrorhamnose 3,5-epimerase